MQKKSLHSILCSLLLAASAQADRSCMQDTCDYTESADTCCGDRWSRDGSAGIDSFGYNPSNNYNNAQESSNPSSPSNGSSDSSQPGSPSNGGQPGSQSGASNAGSSDAGSAGSGSGSSSGRYARRVMGNATRNAIIADTVATTALTGAVIGSTIYQARQDNRYRDNYYSRRRRYGTLDRGVAAASTAAVVTFPNGYATAANNRSFCGPVVVEAPIYNLLGNYRALFVKPTTSNLDFAVVSCAPSATSGASNYNTQSVNTHYTYGFDIGACMRLPYCANVGLNYEHFKTSSTSFAQGSTDGLCVVSPIYQACDCALGNTSGGGGAVIPADAVPLARGTVDFKFDAVHALLGQYLQVSQWFQVHLFAGVNYSSIKQRTTTSFSTVSAVDLDNRIISTPMKFTGVGPEFGADFNYIALWGFKFAGRLSTAILLGHSTNYSTISSLSQANADFCAVNPTAQVLGINKRTQAVPEFQGRIGAGFDFSLLGVVTAFEAGFEARMYLNALQAQQITSLASQAGLAPLASQITVGSLSRNTSDFALSGAYLSFTAGF